MIRPGGSDEAPPKMVLDQRIAGNNNILIGQAGNIHINQESATRDAEKLLAAATVSFIKKKYQDATAHAAAAVQHLSGARDPELWNNGNLLLGRASFEWYRSARDKKILREHSMPAFQAFLASPGAAKEFAQVRAEVFASLAWCASYLGNESQAQEFSDAVGREVGPHDQLSRWAARSIKQAKLVDNVKASGIAIGVLVGWAAFVGVILVFVVYPIVDWLLS